MPFQKQGKKYVSPSGKEMSKKQVQAYYTKKGKKR